MMELLKKLLYRVRLLIPPVLVKAIEVSTVKNAARHRFEALPPGEEKKAAYSEYIAHCAESVAAWDTYFAEYPRVKPKFRSKEELLKYVLKLVHIAKEEKLAKEHHKSVAVAHYKAMVVAHKKGDVTEDVVLAAKAAREAAEAAWHDEVRVSEQAWEKYHEIKEELAAA
jgi:hypothetical protein